MSEAKNSLIFHAVLQDYSGWEHQILRATLYPDQKIEVRMPDSLENLLDEVGKSREFPEETSREILQAQRELHALASAMLQNGERPDLETFDRFLHSYEEFTTRLDRIDMDGMLEDFGVDPSTGLRSARVMYADLDREMERRARRGQAFALVLTQIDKPDHKAVAAQLKILAKALRRCLRSFDDAYLSGTHEVLISLKQTDTHGALRFVERLKEALLREQADFTLTSCVAEPTPGDDLRALVANIRADLQGVAKQGAGETVEHEEMSPLQRYIKSLSE